jgi:hypothetical protein
VFNLLRDPINGGERKEEKEIAGGGSGGEEKQQHTWSSTIDNARTNFDDFFLTFEQLKRIGSRSKEECPSRALALASKCIKTLSRDDRTKPFAIAAIDLHLCNMLKHFGTLSRIKIPLPLYYIV